MFLLATVIGDSVLVTSAVVFIIIIIIIIISLCSSIKVARYNRPRLRNGVNRNLYTLQRFYYYYCYYYYNY